MDDNSSHESNLKEQVDLIRQVFGYASRFKGRTFVFKIDYSVIDDPGFPILVRDLAILHRAGINVVLVPGAQERIDDILGRYGIECTVVRNVRIATHEAMPFIKMAAFDAANRVMTLISGANVQSVIGNWIGARSMGVIAGVDYQDSGIVDKIDIDMIRKVLADGLIPIFPCIGWNAVGKPYNLSSDDLATALSVGLGADKLFFVTGHASIIDRGYQLPENAQTSEDGRLSRMTLPEAAVFLLLNGERTDDRMVPLLRLAHRACTGGVQRVHILDGRIEGAVLKEVFSNLGVGTMVYANQYEQIRPMRHDDIPEVLRIMAPLVRRGILISRSRVDLEHNLADFVVYEVDGTIHGCGGLHRYPGGFAEVLGIAVDGRYAQLGIGHRVVKYLIEHARRTGVGRVYVLTTQTSDWFEKLGFQPGGLGDIPEQKQAVYDTGRNSRILTLDLSAVEDDEA